MLNYLKKKNIKIGILGGTFDPAHKGHLVISRIAKEKIKLNYIIWSITQKNPFKKQPKINIEKRIKISKKITKKDRFIKIEFLEHKINSKKTIDTIKFLKKINRLPLHSSTIFKILSQYSFILKSLLMPSEVSMKKLSESP